VELNNEDTASKKLCSTKWANKYGNHQICIINTVFSEKLAGRPDNYFHNNLDKASVQQIISDPSGSRSGSTTLYFYAFACWVKHVMHAPTATEKYSGLWHRRSPLLPGLLLGHPLQHASSVNIQDLHLAAGATVHDLRHAASANVQDLNLVAIAIVQDSRICTLLLVQLSRICTLLRLSRTCSLLLEQMSRNCILLLV
jgi:hypothetical protein